jgi:hypothetical protein
MQPANPAVEAEPLSWNESWPKLSKEISPEQRWPRQCKFDVGPTALEEGHKGASGVIHAEPQVFDPLLYFAHLIGSFPVSS